MIPGEQFFQRMGEGGNDRGHGKKLRRGTTLPLLRSGRSYFPGIVREGIFQGSSLDLRWELPPMLWVEALVMGLLPGVIPW